MAAAHRCFIWLCAIIALLYCVRVINGVRIINADTTGFIYDDSIIASIAPPFPGWSVSGGGNGDRQNITYESNSDTYFIGPFGGASGGTTTNQWIISQEFYCRKPSSVNVEYTLYWCGTTEPDDYAKLDLNGNQQTITWGNFDKWDGYVSADNMIELIQYCNRPSDDDDWRYKLYNFSLNSIPSVAAKTPFTVKFEIGQSAGTEWAAIQGVKVKCTAFPTEAPTTSPSKDPSLAPSISPTTDEPTTSYPVTSSPSTPASTSLTTSLISGLCFISQI